MTLRRTLKPIDALLVLAIVALVALPVAASLLASREPVVPEEGPALPPLPASGPGGELRAVPAFAERAPLELPHGAAGAAQVRRDARRLADALLGERGGRRLLALTRAPSASAFLPAEDDRYPPPIPELEALLDRALPRALDPERTATANDLGAMLIHASVGRREGAARPGLPRGARVAYAVLDRARHGRACEPQLNLAFLLAADLHPNDDAVQRELSRAAELCPADPTPLWLLGQFHSQRARRTGASDGVRAAAARAGAAFARLQRQFPRSALGWSGAADADLRRGYQVVIRRPFTAREHFRRALALYRRARALSRDPGVRAGEARALAALGQFPRAVEAQRAALGERSDLAPLQVRLVEYLERRRDYAAAAEAAQPLVAGARFPTGPGYFAASGGAGADDALELEDAFGPLSSGVDRLVALSVDLGVEQPGAAMGIVEVAFIPAYRPVFGVTGHTPWCTAWALRRDQVLAGRAEEAFAAAPFRITDIRPGVGGCPFGARRLEAIAAVEAGERSGDGSLHRDRQDLWRFAGDLDRARRAATAWRRAVPRDPTALDRAGEIEFLARRHRQAERFFARAVTAARARHGRPSIAEADALLKQGTALARLGRHGEALDTLAEAEATASRAPGRGGGGAASLVSYHAFAQAGYAALRARRFDVAIRAYLSARDRGRGLGGVGFAPQSTTRLEVTYNNLALAQLKAGEPRAALRSATAATRFDPRNPYTLATRGYALAVLGRDREARPWLRAALRDYPRQFATWNDLGVVEARLGDGDAAIAALRRAVGVDPGYALGWFNLGVALEGQGLSHALRAQGAYGRAFELDGELRERERKLTLDDEVYFANLDLSKPLPAEWEFAQRRGDAPAQTVGLILVLVSALGVGRSLAASTRLKATLSFLRAGVGLLARTRVAGAFGPASVAVAATLLVFLLPFLRSGDWSRLDLALVAGGAGALMLIVWRARALAARAEGAELEQRAWGPGIVVATVASLLGAAWAPLPVARAAREGSAVHWAGPAAAGGVAVCLLPFALWLDVPAAGTVAAAGLVMAASMLTPIAPLDGGELAKREGGTATSAALLAGALFTLVVLS
ncbi:MAG TPA: hypothetical protein VHF89_00730 [Solirubrobacteraceae bacterium]|nr:hypothetical protein [Solirubrobacteraceae bacterium]